jgi:hypothetical protein
MVLELWGAVSFIMYCESIAGKAACTEHVHVHVHVHDGSCGDCAEQATPGSPKDLHGIVLQSAIEWQEGRMGAP